MTDRSSEERSQFEKPKRNPKSRGPWPDWIESEEGRRCATFETLKAPEYLENRLWAAFCAGMAAERNK